MTLTNVTPPYTLEADQKCAQLMIYTQDALYWGEVVVKQVIRVSTWLRTNSAPDRLTLYNARALHTTSNTGVKPMQFTELHLAVSQVMAYHLVPPAHDPIDYDPTEPNRRMQPASMLIGSFRIDGHIRLASQSNLAKFLEITRETFTGIYDAKITNFLMPSLGVISVPFLLVRQETTVFTLP